MISVMFNPPPAPTVMIDIDLLVRCGGLRVLLHCLSEGPGELTPLLASTFLYIVDLPRTRSYLRPGSDLEVSLPYFPSHPMTLMWL
jgi:rapamycin-insensitive companion of mTOR